MKKILITGSTGLVGSETVKYFIEKDYQVIGIDNDMRKYFFGDEASTVWKQIELENKYKKAYKHFKVDIRDIEAIEEIFKKYNFDVIVHAAAQPSHDWAVKEPITDFSINANGTLILLENFRKYSPSATFIFMSTNKVYGDTPNRLPLIELEKRYEIDEKHPYFKDGIDENMSIDNSKHSLFGASKVAADILVQEYGKYFNLHTGVFRGGCITGPAHSGAKLHGFLAYLVKCIYLGHKYIVYGYKGKQVRDNIHAYDLVNMFWNYHLEPKYGEVYNVGGSRYSNTSILESIEKIEKILNKKAIFEYVDKNRIGDHIWYISNVNKFKSHYKNWKYRYNFDQILEEICEKGHFF